MKKYSMVISALFVAAPGLFLIGAGGEGVRLWAMEIVLLLWAAMEFYIGRGRTFADIMPRHRLIPIARALWLFFVIYSWMDHRYRWTATAVHPGTAAALLGLCLFALAIRTWAIVHLGRSFSYDVKPPEGGLLIKDGPYRFIRHPSYLGISLLATLPGIILGSVVGFLGLTMATLVQTVLRIIDENRILRGQFGEIYEDYARRAYNLIPFIY